MGAPLGERPAVTQNTSARAVERHAVAEPVPSTTDVTRPRGRGRGLLSAGFASLALVTLLSDAPRPATADRPQSDAPVTLVAHSGELPTSLVTTEPSPVTEALLNRTDRHRDRFAGIVLREYDRLKTESPGDTFHSPDARPELGFIGDEIPEGPVEVYAVRLPGKAPEGQTGNFFGFVEVQTDPSGARNIAGVQLLELRTKPETRQTAPEKPSEFTDFLLGGRTPIGFEVAGIQGDAQTGRSAIAAEAREGFTREKRLTTRGAHDNQKETDQLTNDGLTDVVKAAETLLANARQGLTGLGLKQ